MGIVGVHQEEKRGVLLDARHPQILNDRLQGVLKRPDLAFAFGSGERRPAHHHPLMQEIHTLHLGETEVRGVAVYLESL